MANKYVKQRLHTIHMDTGASLTEVSEFFQKTLNWVVVNTSAEGDYAVSICLNETLKTFKSQ